MKPKSKPYNEITTPLLVDKKNERTTLNSIIGFTEGELREYCKKRGFQAFHGTQIFNWIYIRNIKNFYKMTDVPEQLRKILSKNFTLNNLKISKKKVSNDNETIKYGFILEDNREIESVFLKDSNERVTFCISTQVGCPVGCLYCATGKMGLKRNLSSGEIINQVLTLTNLEQRPNNIVFMGMGEPLLNYDNLIKAINILETMNIGHRKITVSTCGVINGIYKLAKTGLNPKLAVSLGSAIEKKRKMLIPFARTHEIDELLKAIIFYRNITKRRVSLEYTIINGVNDSLDDAIALAKFARAAFAHVNIIRYNPIPGINFLKPDAKIVDKFKNYLIKKGIRVSERYRRGNEIKAACGQLITKG